MRRRAFLGAALAAAAWNARGAIPPRAQAGDFDVLWRSIDGGYAYFDAASRARWRAVRERLGAQASRAQPALFPRLLDSAIAQLRDDHVTLAGAAAPAARRIPYDLDIWPRWDDGRALIESVRTFHDADVAGLHAGQVVTHVQGTPVEAAAREVLGGASATLADMEWALRRVVAGPRAGTQRLQLREGVKLAMVDIERTPPAPSTSPPILGRRMGEERDIAYIRVRVGSKEAQLASQFDGALSHMTGTRALILDLRDTAGPGSRETTRAILSRFARAPAAWQVRQAPRAKPVPDVIEPREPRAANGPFLVLVDRWTAGEGEALAAGLAAVAGARIVGTPMAGLRGELHEVTLPASGLVLRYPGERVLLPAGGPRESLKPSVAVDLAAPSGGPGDPILYQALKLLERR